MYCPRLIIKQKDSVTVLMSMAVHLQELLGELNLGPMRSGVPMLAVSLALEAKASHRELTSRLLADLCGPVLTCGDVENAFDKLLSELPELVLDTPGAPQVRGFVVAGGGGGGGGGGRLVLPLMTSIVFFFI